MVMQGGAAVARWVHTPKVAGSTPVPASTSPSPCGMDGLGAPPQPHPLHIHACIFMHDERRPITTYPHIHACRMHIMPRANKGLKRDKPREVGLQSTEWNGSK